MVREAGYDARSRAFLTDLADHFDEVAILAAGTARAFRRLAEIK